MASTKIRDGAERLLRDVAINAAPVPVERLAHRLGAQTRYEPFRGELSDMQCRENGRVIIGVNSLLHDSDSLHVDKTFRVRMRDGVSTLGSHWKEVDAN